MKANKMFIVPFFPLALGLLISCSSVDSSPNSASEGLSSGQKLTKQELKVLSRLQEPSNRIGMEEAVHIANKFVATVRKSNSIDSFYKSDSLLAPLYKKNPVLKTELNEEEVAFDIRIKSTSAFLLKDIIIEAGRFNDIDFPDTLAYVLDFSDSAGFAIVAADTRIDSPVLLFVDKGSFNRQTDNPGMILFYKMLDSYLVNSIAESELHKDSLLNSALNKLGIENVKDIDDVANINSRFATKVTI